MREDCFLRHVSTLRLNHCCARRGISELMASLITIAITLIGGIAAFGFINGQIGVSSRQIGAGVANNVNFLRERSVITYANFPSVAPINGGPGNDSLEIWL